MPVKLRDGVGMPAAIKAIKDIVAWSTQINLSDPAASTDYLDWIEKSERRLQNVFAEPDTGQQLYSYQYWRIRDMSPAEPRPLQLVHMEVERQVTRLRKTQAQLEAYSDWVARTTGTLAVVDTNILLHFQPPDQIDWAAVVGSEAVRLVVPLRVVEELDQKKYSSEKLAKRARTVLSQLSGFLVPAKDDANLIRSGTSIEIAPYEEPRTRPPDADWEILTCCRNLIDYSNEVVLLTGDSAMRIRATQLGINCIDMPKKYRRSLDVA